MSKKTGLSKVKKALKKKEQEILDTQDALIEAMKRFGDIFSQSPIGMSVCDPSGEVIVGNRAYLNIFEVSSFSEINLHNIFNDFKLPAAIVKKVKSGKPVQHEVEYNFEKTKFVNSRTGTGSILFTISTLETKGKTSGYLVQMQDTTERNKIAEHQRLAQMGRLLADMAHELNNPLMIMAGRAELALHEGIKSDKIKHGMEIILNQAYCARDIIQRLRAYSRVGKTEKISLEIPETIDMIMKILEHPLKNTNIEVLEEIPGDLPCIKANEKQLQEVFMNIVNNAVDAMPEGGKIIIRAQQDGDNVCIEFEDTGEGMPKRVMDKIYQPFYTTKGKDGTGLGVSICDTIINRHGGELRYKSKIGKGTTATIILPI